MPATITVATAVGVGNSTVNTTINATSIYVTSLGVGTATIGGTGEIRATNNITAYYSSDISLKENVRAIPDALTKVDYIGGKLFDWTDTVVVARGGEDKYFVNKADFGVIAQDVQSVFPIATRIRPDGLLAVDYEKLCALAFQAIKELKIEVDNLKNRIESN